MFDEISDVTSSAMSAALRSLPCLEAVNTSLICEYQQTVLTETSKDGFREILIFRGDTFAALSTAVLDTECFNGQVTDVIVFRE